MRDSEAKRQKIGEVEGEKEEGTLSGKMCALLAAKRKAMMDARSSEVPLRRCVT